MPPNNSAFPSDFVWGVSTAAPQIEGGAFAGGKGESVWDRFCRIPGRIHNGDTLDVACDHYNRFREDFALMRSLGIRNYRLSIAWPRIYPKGDGAVNQAGLDFYHSIFESMAENGITPWVTLFHWDMPQALEDRGGWPSPLVVDAFAAYADTVVKAYSGRVRNWITLNEIRCFTKLAYGPASFKAPGRVEPAQIVNQTVHHALLCHGHAVRAVRAHGGVGARVGLTDNCESAIPVTETPADIEAARAWFVEGNLPILDAVYRGKYSEDYLARIGDDAPAVGAGDFALISAPTDFLGINLYTGPFVRAAAGAGYEVVPMPNNYPCADSRWIKFTPQVIYWALRFVHETYGVKAIYITENGCSYDIEPVVKGYFVWSFVDNYEWEDGYARRFGLVHVDYATQRRTPKLSARYYSEVIRQNRIL